MHLSRTLFPIRGSMAALAVLVAGWSTLSAAPFRTVQVGIPAPATHGGTYSNYTGPAHTGFYRGPYHYGSHYGHTYPFGYGGGFYGYGGYYSPGYVNPFYYGGAFPNVILNYTADAPAYYGGGPLGARIPDSRLLDTIPSLTAPYYPLRPLNSGLGLPPVQDATPVPDGQAEITLRVPAEAVVYLQGQRMKQTGTERHYLSPKLEPGQTYHYDVRAKWEENGQAVDQKADIFVQAGDRKSMSFFAAGPTSAPKDTATGTTNAKTSGR